MHFRPCIDIHNGKVKQIVGASLRDSGNAAKDNFISDRPSEYYADLYKKNELENAHVIILNSGDSEFYKASRDEAKAALREYSGHMMVGGGITAENAAEYLDAGANAVIVTSYVFKNGHIDEKNLNKILMEIGPEHLVLDLTCRYRLQSETDKSKNKNISGYYVVTDRWQKFSNEIVTPDMLHRLSSSCREFLIHGADSEGMKLGIEKNLCTMLGNYLLDDKYNEKNPITYAGGISSIEDIELLNRLSGGRLDFTIGSALDIFGGYIQFKEIAYKYR